MRELTEIGNKDQTGEEMDWDEFSVKLPKKLKYWTLHCLINALPSYIIAVSWLGLWTNPAAHLGMIAAVISFIVAFAVMTSLSGPLSRSGSLLSRALRVGLIMRIFCSAWTLLMIPTGAFLMLTPDFWCGQIAVNIVKFIYQIFGEEAILLASIRGSGSGASQLVAGFTEVYLTTLIEGAILSLMLFTFSVVAVVILQARDRKKLYATAP